MALAVLHGLDQPSLLEDNVCKYGHVIIVHACIVPTISVSGYLHITVLSLIIQSHKTKVSGRYTLTDYTWETQICVRSPGRVRTTLPVVIIIVYRRP